MNDQDFNSMSDEELVHYLNENGIESSIPAHPKDQDFSSMSDKELIDYLNKNGIEASMPSSPKESEVPYKFDTFQEHLKERREKIPGELKDAGRRFLGGARSALAGIGDIVGSGDAIARNIDVLTHGKLRPRTEEEENSEKIARPLASLLPGAGATKLISKLGAPALKGAAGYAERGLRNYLNTQKIEPGLRSYGASAASTVAGQKAANEFANSPSYFDSELDPKLSAIERSLKPLLGGIATGTAAGLGVAAVPGAVKGAYGIAKNPLKATARGLGKPFGYNAEKGRTIAEAGQPTTLGSISDFDTIKTFERFLSNAAHGPYKKIASKQSENLKKTLGIGESPSTKREFGENIHETLEGIHNKARESVRKKSDLFESNRRKAGVTHAPLSEVHKHIKQLMPESGDIDLIKEWKKTPAGSIYSKLDKKGLGDKSVLSSFEYIKDLKKKIGRHVNSKFSELSDPEKEELKGIYGKLLDTQEKAIQNVENPTLRNKLEKDFKGYREEWHHHMTKEAPILKQVQKNMKQGVGIVYDKFMTNVRQGKSDLDVVLPHLSKHEAFSFMGDFMHNMGLTKEGTFSNMEWARRYRSLQPEQKDILKDSFKKIHGTSGDILDKSSDVFKYTAETLAQGNHSGTAKTLSSAATIGTLGGGLALINKGDVAAGTALMASKLAGWGTAAALNHGVFGNQKFIKFLDYGHQVKHPSQIPILFRKLEQVPGIPKESVHKMKNFYASAYKEIFKETPNLKSRTILASVRSPNKEQEREKWPEKIVI